MPYFSTRAVLTAFARFWESFLLYALEWVLSASEVWNLLAAVKTEWTRYGEILNKVQKKLHEASDALDKAQTRTRVIGKKLKDVQELPEGQSDVLLKVDTEV